MAKYIFNEKNYCGIYRLMQEIENTLNVENEYDNMLDDMYGDIEICGQNYPVSVALYNVDETAYSFGRKKYESEIIEKIECEIKNLKEGNLYERYNLKIECIADHYSD